MRQFPIFFTLYDRVVLVVGGGESAARKLRLLMKAGAQVQVIAPKVTGEISSLAKSGAIDWQAREFQSNDIDGKALAYGATDNDEIDQTVTRAARSYGVPVNIVDRPELSDFITPAIVERDLITVAISSGGAAPVLARFVKSAIERLLHPNLGRLARFAERFRNAVKAVTPEGQARLRFWDKFFDGPIAARVLAGDEIRATEDMLSFVNKPSTESEAGLVHIVGAGPGDADLITLRAQSLLQKADVIVYDKLVTSEVIDLARRDAERIYVGKAPGHHVKTQDQINSILIEQAENGRRVVRLKGGDPFIFGRGGEELAALKAAGIQVEVVPGITAASGCAAAVGLPLTHRDHATSVTFVTGHGKAKDGVADVDWKALAQAGGTIAVYMGVAEASRISAELCRYGLAGKSVAIIENGARSDQRLITGHVEGLGRLMKDREITGPAMIVIGDVASLVDAPEDTEHDEFPFTTMIAATA